MCQLDTTGIEYACGHYIPSTYDKMHDCGSKYCTKSESHPSNCKSIDCIQYFGPDRNQTLSEVSSEYCTRCKEGFFTNQITIRRSW